MTQKNREKIQEAINVLVEEGKKSYKTEYQDQTNKWACIGMAISHQYQYATDMLEKVYAIAEDWNHHSFCNVLDFVFRSDNGDKFWLDHLKWDLPAFLNKELIVNTVWNTKTFSYDKKKIRVHVVIEEVEEDFPVQENIEDIPSHYQDEIGNSPLDKMGISAIIEA